MPAADTPQGTGISGAAEAIAALLTPEGDTKPLESKEAPSPEEGTLEGNPEGEETTEAPEGEEGAPEEKPNDGEDTPQDPPAEPETLTVEIDGKSVVLPREEVTKGYLRQQDYSRKTQDLAERRRAFQEVEKSVAQERETYAQLIPALRQQLERTLPQEPDPALLDTDPVTYLRAERAYRDHLTRLHAAQQEEARTQALRSQEQQEALKARLEEAKQKLADSMPAWRDPAKWDADRPKIQAYGLKAGFTAEELQNTYDPRAVVALYKAMKYDELMARQPKPVVNAGPKTAPAGSAQSAPRSNTEHTKAKQRLAQTGRVADAVTALKGLL